MVILADALDPNKKGVGAAQGSCLGDYMAVAIERCNGATDFGATCFFFFMSHLFFTRFFCWGWHFETWKKQRDGKASSFAYNPIASHRSHRPGSNILWSWSFFVLWHCKLIWPSPIWNKQLESLKLFLTGTIRRQARNMMTSLELLCLWPENIGIFHVFCCWIFSGLCLGMGFLEQTTDTQIHRYTPRVRAIPIKTHMFVTFKFIQVFVESLFFSIFSNAYFISHVSKLRLYIFTCRNGEVSIRRPMTSMPWNARSSFDLANSIAVKPMAHAWEICPAVPRWRWGTVPLDSHKFGASRWGQCFPHDSTPSCVNYQAAMGWFCAMLRFIFFDLPWLSRRAPPNQIINPFSLRHRYAVIQCRKCWDETVVFFCTNQPTGLRHPKLIQLSSSYWCVCVWKLWSF